MKNSLFSFHGPFPVSPSGSPGPAPTGSAGSSPWLQPALPQPSKSLQPSKSPCYMLFSQILAHPYRMRGLRLSHTNPEIYSAQEGVK